MRLEPWHEDEHVSARGTTKMTCPFRRLRRQGWLRKFPGAKYLPGLPEQTANGAREQPVIPDLDKWIGEDVREKGADKLLGGDGREPDLA